MHALEFFFGRTALIAGLIGEQDDNEPGIMGQNER